MTELKVLGVVFDSRQDNTCKYSTSSKHGIMRKALCLFGNSVLVLRYFWSFLLPVLEYCSPVWMSVAASHLGLFDLVGSKAVSLSDGRLCVI